MGICWPVGLPQWSRRCDDVRLLAGARRGHSVMWCDCAGCKFRCERSNATAIRLTQFIIHCVFFHFLAPHCYHPDTVCWPLPIVFLGFLDTRVHFNSVSYLCLFFAVAIAVDVTVLVVAPSSPAAFWLLRACPFAPALAS